MLMGKLLTTLKMGGERWRLEERRRRMARHAIMVMSKDCEDYIF
jgi:hypothetical protein